MNSNQALKLANDVLGNSNEFYKIAGFICHQKDRTHGTAEYRPRIRQTNRKIIFKLSVKRSLFRNIKVVKKK